MILTNKIAEIVTGGKSNKNWEATGVSIDTRSINQGNLFIAIEGNRFNAHNFINEAFLNGAAAAVINEKYLKEEYLKYPLLIVKDTEKALVEIAKKVREQFTGIIIAITGSVGKTTTKEMLKLLLRDVSKVYASKGNLNNYIGLPLSLANLDNNYHEIAIFELGMNRAQEIAYLTNILKPHIGVITEISNTHSKFFKSLTQIFLAKMEIITGLKGKKILFFNANNCFFNQAQDIAVKENIVLYSFGEMNPNINRLSEETQADFVLVNSDIKSKLINEELVVNQKIVAKIDNDFYTYNLPSLAKHKGVLSVLVLGLVKILGLNVHDLISRFNHYKEINGRGEIINIRISSKVRIFVIDDSYNASPLSMQKSILMLKNIHIHARKILVLGDMLELKNEQLEHKNLKDYILEIEPDAIFTLGFRMQQLVNVLPDSIYKANFINFSELYQKLISYLVNHDIVLIKGSLGSETYKITNLLKKLHNIS